MLVRLSIVKSAVADGKYRVALQTGRRSGFEEFLNWVQDASALTASDARAAIHMAAEWIVHRAAEGRECDLGPLGRSRLGMKGVFDELPERVLDDDVTLTVSWVFPNKLKKQVKHAGDRMVRLHRNALPTAPNILDVKCFSTAVQGWERNCWEPGGVLHLYGSHLKFDLAREDEGVFLKRLSDGETVRLERYLDVYDKNVRCLIPSELAGWRMVTVTVKARPRKTEDPPNESQYGEPLTEC